MKQKKTILIFSLIAAGFSLLMCIGALTFLGPCIHEDGTTGICREAGTLSAILGGCAAAFALLSTAVRNKGKLAVCLLILTAGCGAAAFFVPGGIKPLCMMDTMRCRAIMTPAVKLLSGLILVSTLPGMISGVREGTK